MNINGSDKYNRTSVGTAESMFLYFPSAADQTVVHVRVSKCCLMTCWKNKGKAVMRSPTASHRSSLFLYVFIYFRGRQHVPVVSRRREEKYCLSFAQTDRRWSGVNLPNKKSMSFSFLVVREAQSDRRKSS